jgi:uncharacterized repeat protein (TIGR02543 family)
MISWLKTYYSSTWGRKPVWVFGDGLFYKESEDFLKFLIAEGYASGVVFEVPYTLKVFLPTGGYHEYLSEPKNQAKLVAARNYTGFIQDHRDLFTHVSPSARVALIYSIPTVMWDYAPLFYDGDRWVGRLVGLQGYALALEQDHVPYDVLTFGHPDFMNDESTLAKLGLYDTVILPSIECVSSAQLTALRDYVASGGRLILIGPAPRFDENRTPLREGDVAWLEGQGLRSFGLGTIINLSDSLNENEAVRYWLAQIAGQGNGSSDLSVLLDPINTGHERDIETNAPPSVAITCFTREKGIVLHLLNYAYGNGSVSNVSVSVKLPGGFLLGDVVLASPDLRGDTEIQYALEDGRLVFTVPELKIWDIVVISSLNAEYRVDVSSERGTISGAGWFVAGTTANVSISPATIEKDFFTNYVFEGWIVSGAIISTSPSYSFTVTGPISLTANWNTELNLTTMSAVGVGALLITGIAFFVLRRRKAPDQPDPSSSAV